MEGQRSTNLDTGPTKHTESTLSMLAPQLTSGVGADFDTDVLMPGDDMRQFLDQEFPLADFYDGQE